MSSSANTMKSFRVIFKQMIKLSETQGSERNTLAKLFFFVTESFLPPPPPLIFPLSIFSLSLCRSYVTQNFQCQSSAVLYRETTRPGRKAVCAGFLTVTLFTSKSLVGIPVSLTLTVFIVFMLVTHLNIIFPFLSLYFRYARKHFNTLCGRHFCLNVTSQNIWKFFFSPHSSFFFCR